MRHSVGQVLWDFRNIQLQAECLKDTTVIRFAKEFVADVTEADPLNGMEFYRRLARVLGNRLIHSYRSETDTVSDGLEYSFGTGQDIESYTKP